MSRELQNKSSLQFIHLTDCHLGDTKSICYNNVNTWQRLSDVCQAILNLNTTPDFILVTGDISQTGNKRSYDLFFTLMECFNVPVFCLPGNHDDPELLQSYCEYSPIKTPNRITIKNIDLILLNTKVDNEEYGDLSDSAIEQLKQHLMNAHTPAIIAMHHPAIPSNTAWMDNICLQNKDEVRQFFISQPNIKLVLNGHLHMGFEILVQGTHFISSPSTCYQFKQGVDELEFDPPVSAFRSISINSEFKIESRLYRI